MLTLHRTLIILLLIAAFGGFINQAPAHTPALVVTLMGAIIYGPVLIFLRPAWRADPRQLLWFCILLMFYFCGYSLQIMTSAPLFYWVLARLLVVISLFVTSSVLIKQVKKKNNITA